MLAPRLIAVALLLGVGCREGGVAGTGAACSDSVACRRGYNCVNARCVPGVEDASPPDAEPPPPDVEPDLTPDSPPDSPPDRVVDHPPDTRERQPIIIAYGQGGPRRLCLDAVNVYWANSSGEIMKARLDGTQPEMLVLDLQKPVGIASDGERVYWTDHASLEIWSIPVGGGKPENVASGQDHADDIAVDARNLYWGTLGGIMVMPKGGGAPRPLVTGEAYQAYFLALDDGAVYWTAIADGFIFSAPKTGAVLARRLASGQRTPWGIVPDATSVYWVDNREHAVKRSAKDGSEQAVVVSADLTGPETIAADATHLYVADGAAGAIVKLSKDGSERTVLVSGLSTPSAVAVDETSVYFTAFNGGQVMKVEK